MQLTLDNRSRDYSTENQSSLLYGTLNPGHAIRWQTLFNGSVYYLMTGKLQNIVPNPNIPDVTVDLPALGNLGSLRNNVSTGVLQSATVDMCVAAVLDAAGWPSAKRVLSTSSVVLPFWWVENTDAFSALVTLYNTEGPGAALYEDGMGNIVFEDHHYRQVTARSNTIQATWHADINEPTFDPDTFAWDPGILNVINDIELDVNVLAIAGAASVVWSATQDYVIGGSQTYNLKIVANSPFVNAITPVAGTDFTIVSGSVSSVTLNRTSGQSLTITFVAGAGGVTIRNPQLRAQALTTVATQRLTPTLDVSASIATYGLNSYSGSIWSTMDLGGAQDLVNSIVGQYGSPRPSVNIDFAGISFERQTQIYAREISDRVHVIEAQTGADADVSIERKIVTITDEGRWVNATFGCEKIPAGASDAQWGLAQWDISLWSN